MKKEDLSEKEHAAYMAGYIQALYDFAWWKDGVKYVGCGSTTFAAARDQAIRDYLGETKEFKP